MNYITVLTYHILQNSLILKNIPTTYKANELFYCVMYDTSYKLKEKDCRKQPGLRCKFEHVAESVIIQGTEYFNCSGMLCLNN